MTQALHYTTQNRPLAHTLACAGFELLTVWNTYDAACLDRLGEASAESAKENGKPGILTYVFRREDDLEKAARAWDDAGARIKKGEMVKTAAEREDAAKIIRAAIDTGGPFRDVWKMYPPIFVSRVEGEVVKERNADGSITETHPGFKFCSPGITDEMRGKLNV